MIKPLIDNLPRALIREPPFRIVFHHVPKCGGTSVSYALRHCLPLRFGRRADASLGAEATVRTAAITGRPVSAVREELLLYHMALPHVAYISGHMPVSERAFGEYGHAWSFVTVLRDPVSRWFSGYFYNRYGRKRHHASVDVGIEEHLESPRGRRAGSTYVRFFSGLPDAEPDLDRAIKMAKRFAVIGALEDLDGFRKAFNARFQTRIRNIRHINSSPASDRQQRERVAADLVARVAEICRPDVEFYQTVLSRQLEYD